MPKFAPLPILAATCTALPLVLSADIAAADHYFNNDVIVDANIICVGPDCIDGEPLIPGRSGLKVKATRPALLFDDTSSNSGFPKDDWQITINETTAGSKDIFMIENITDNRIPFAIESSVRDSLIYVNDSGYVGFGTNEPVRSLHTKTGNTPGLRLQQDGSNGFAQQTYDVAANETGFFINDVTALTIPFKIEPGAPANSMFITPEGDLGVGTGNPAGKLHVKGEGVQLAYIESADGGPVQMRFATNSENRRFLAVDNDDNVKSQIIFGDNEIKFTGETDRGADLWLTIGPGGIVSQGPTCSPNPCDRTFDTDFFTVSSIEERAEFMWENMYLPAVGPTKPHEPFNLTEKTAGILHELEVAHIYIAQQQEVIVEQEHRLSAYEGKLAQLAARLDALEVE